jgi:hypothetical protein
VLESKISPLEIYDSKGVQLLLILMPKEIKLKYFCQNSKEHPTGKPHEVSENDRFCIVCLRELDWGQAKMIGYSYYDPGTRPIYPLNFENFTKEM